MVDRAAVHVPRRRGRRRARPGATPRFAQSARGARRSASARRDAPSSAADGQHLARRRRVARCAGFLEPHRRDPCRARRRMRPCSSSRRSNAQPSAILEHAVDLRAVPARQRILRARRPAARDAVDSAPRRRPHRDRGCVGVGLTLVSRKLWLALLGSALPASLAAADPAAWRVTDGRGGELTLLGSMHVLRPTDYPLPPAIDSLVERTDLVVMEIDLDDIDAMAQQRTILQTAMLPQGTVLRDVVDEEVYRVVEQRVRELGVDLAGLERFEPWFLAITVLDLGMRKIGFQAERGVEQYVLGRAQAAGKEVVGLETLEFQLGLFDALPAEQQQAL